jgi:hypothetical protein
MKVKWLLLILTILALAFSGSAADNISGTWKGTADTPVGKVQRTFNFKVDGTKLTGESTSDVLGNSTIQDGKIDGDTITFTIDVTIQGNQAKANYTGKVEGDQIKMSVKVEGVEQTIEYSVTRVK